MTRFLQFMPAFAASAFTALAFTNASASVAPTLTLGEQAQKADVVLRGSLGAPQSVTKGSVTWRAYPLTVTEVVSGSTNGMPQLDGGAALYIWPDADDLPNWRTGQDAFFLLYKKRLDSPLVGFNQGYYAVRDNAVTVAETELSVDDFRSQVLTARGEAPAAPKPATPATESAEPEVPAPTTPAPTTPKPTESAPSAPNTQNAPETNDAPETKTEGQ